jgi:competence protein ComEA
MDAIWWAWRSLHIAERILLAAALLLIAFCGGASWQMAHPNRSSSVLLREPPENELIKWDSGASIIADVSGVVRHPGIVHVPRGSRVRDALKMAGGALPGADTSTLNQAALLNDGQQIQVGEMPDKSTSAKSTFMAGQPININRAGAAELQVLPHIGPAMAQRIIEYRTSHGDFKNLDDLDGVKGIGAKTLEKIAPLIVFH